MDSLGQVVGSCISLHSARCHSGGSGYVVFEGVMKGPQDIPVFGETTQPQSVHDTIDPAPQVTVCTRGAVIGYWKLELALRSKGQALTGFLDIHFVLCARLNLAPIDPFEVPCLCTVSPASPRRRLRGIHRPG